MEINERTLMLPGERTWRISQFIWVFQDNERHLGHVVKSDSWQAYDATHLNHQEDGIRYLGDFADLETAKAAVEASVAPPDGQKVLCASAGKQAWIF